MTKFGENKMSMQSTTAPARHLAPRITLSHDDYERLSALVNGATLSSPDLAATLADEIARAQVLAPEQRPNDAVSMNSDVEFRDDRTGRVHAMQLVYPAESDVSKGKLSVLTPVGAALIGVRVGESITWETPAGEVRQLTVLSVKDP
jgi:regulator of nucleoside diphosphate kinase